MQFTRDTDMLSNFSVYAKGQVKTSLTEAIMEGTFLRINVAAENLAQRVVLWHQ